MKFVIFGLTVSSSWGNGHATLWRGLWRALARRGHQVVIARTPEDSVAAMELSDGDVRWIARAAPERTLAEHTSDRRARDLEDALEECTDGSASESAATPAELERA